MNHRFGVTIVTIAVAVAAFFGGGAVGYQVGHEDGLEYGGEQLRHLQNRMGTGVTVPPVHYDPEPGTAS
jgi:hypothetical protein